MSKNQELRSKMGQYFSFSELKTIAFDFSIDRENLRQETKTDFVIDLINFFGQRGRLPELVARVKKERPKVVWPDISELNLDPAAYEDQPQGPTTIVHGNYHVGDTITVGDNNANVVIKAQLTNLQQQVGQMKQGSDDQKDALQKLLEQLKAEIEKITPDQTAAVEDAEAVSQLSEQLVGMAAAEKPNRTMIEITGEGLKKAVENLAAVTPAAVGIVVQIVSLVKKMVGG